MRNLLIVILLLIPFSALAAHIRCYSADKLIYEGESKKVFYGDGAVIVKDKKTHKDIFLFADCVVVL